MKFDVHVQQLMHNKKYDAEIKGSLCIIEDTTLTTASLDDFICVFVLVCQFFVSSVICFSLGVVILTSYE